MSESRENQSFCRSMPPCQGGGSLCLQFGQDDARVPAKKSPGLVSCACFTPCYVSPCIIVTSSLPPFGWVFVAEDPSQPQKSQWRELKCPGQYLSTVICSLHSIC